MATNTKSFSPSEAIKFGWTTVKNRFWFFLGLQFLMIFVSYLPNFFTDATKDDMYLTFGIIILSTVLQLGLSLGFISISLKAVDGKKAEFNDIFSKFDFILILKLIASGFLTGLAVVAGLLLFIIPGIYIAYRLLFISYLLVDNREMGPIQAMNESWRLTKGHVGVLLILALYALGVTLLGLLAFIVGVFVASSVTSIASAYAYRKIASSPKS